MLAARPAGRESGRRSARNLQPPPSGTMSLGERRPGNSIHPGGNSWAASADNNTEKSGLFSMEEEELGDVFTP